VFNDGRENVHDEARSGRPSLVNDDLVRKVNERVRDDRRCTIPMALGSTHKYQEYFLCGTADRCVGLTTLSPSCAHCIDIWEPQFPLNLRSCPGL